MRKEFLVAVLAIVAVGALSFTVTTFAQGSPQAKSGEFSPIVQRLVEEFELNEDKVESELVEYRNDYREEREAQMEQRFEDRLSEVVSEGSITPEQKEEIITKHEEIQTEMQKTQGLSWEESHEKKEEIREEMRDWMEDQDIELDALGAGLGRMGNHKGSGSGRGFNGQRPLAE